MLSECVFSEHHFLPLCIQLQYLQGNLLYSPPHNLELRFLKKTFFIVCGEQSDYNNVQTFLEQFILTDLVGLFMFVKNECQHQL